MEIITIANEMRNTTVPHALHEEHIKYESRRSSEVPGDTVSISRGAQKRLLKQESGEDALPKGTYSGEEPAAAKDKEDSLQDPATDERTETAKQIREVQERLDDAKLRLSEATGKIDSSAAPEENSDATQASESRAKAAAKAAQSKLRSIAFFSEAMEVEAIKIEIAQLSSQLMALYRSHQSNEQESSASDAAESANAGGVESKGEGEGEKGMPPAA